MISVKYKCTLSKVLRGEKPDWDKILSAGAMIAEREYKIEAPVNVGELRNKVITQKKGDLSYVVTTIATEKGFPYPIAVHEGTGKYKGSADRGRGNWSRNAGYTPEDLAFFKMLAKRGRLSQKPNKFADRAEETALPKIIKFFTKEVDVELHKDTKTVTR